VAQSAEDHTRFLLWECYVDEAAAKAHKTTQHYLTFKAGAADMMAQERVSEVYAGLFPEASAFA